MANNSVTVEEQSFFERQIASFKNKATQFQNAYNTLMGLKSRASMNPTLYAEWQTLANKGFSLRDQINSITGKIDAAVDWFKSTFGEYDLTEQKQLGELGIPPIVLIPLAAIATTGVVAVINSYISNVVLFERKVAEAERLFDQGMTAEEIARILEGTRPPAGGGFFAGLSPVVKWVVIGGGIYVIWQMTRK